MPESLKKSEITSKTDPSVAKQYDSSAPMEKQWSDLYSIIDNLKVSMMNTSRKDLGGIAVGRCMALSSRTGPDLLYLANKHSRKFEDLDNNPAIQINFHDTKSQDWVSITGEATYSSDDARIKDLYSPLISAWFGDLGDGVHDGTANDPRMTLIEVKPKYIVYWKKDVTTLGFVKEVAQAAFMGDVAQTGVQRELVEADIEKERQNAGSAKSESTIASVS